MLHHTLHICPDTQLVDLMRSNPALFYSRFDVLRSRTPEVVKSCAIAALQGLNQQAGHSFPNQSCGNDGWYAHHITKTIFEGQSIFDPYADPSFCHQAERLCYWYTMRYTQPDMLPRPSDFTPEQFAACFATDGALILRKRGCDFCPDSPERDASDMENFRLFVQYCNRDGHYICGDIGLGVIPDSKRNKQNPGIGKLHAHFQIEKDNGAFGYDPSGYTFGDLEYSKEDVLRLINADSIVQYDRVEIIR